MTSAELPGLPGEEGNQDDEDAEANGGNVISLPDEEDLDHEENEDGNGNEERSAVTIRITTRGMVVKLCIELTVAVELVEPDDDESNDDGEGNVEHSASAVIITGDVGTVHTIHVENTNDGNSDVDEPGVIYKGTHAVRTSADVLGNIGLGAGKEVETHSEENET